MDALDIALFVWVLATIYLGAGVGYIQGKYGASAYLEFEEYLEAIVWWLPDVLRKEDEEGD